MKSLQKNSALHLGAFLTLAFLSTVNAASMRASCVNHTNPDVFCLSVIPMSECNGATDTCRCRPGFYEKTDDLGNIFCEKYERGSTCSLKNKTQGDLECRAGMGENAQCGDTGVCECGTGNTTYVKNIGCVPLLETAECDICRRTTGICFDWNQDGVADGCHCPPNRAPSGKTVQEMFARGCDIKKAALGDICDAKYNIVCSDPNSACVHHQSGSYSFCKCQKGYVAVSARWRPGEKDCVPVLTLEEDKNCEQCKSSGGKCFDNSGDSKMDGCLCDATRSSSDISNPTANCDVKHVKVECKAKVMRICYTPHNHTKYARLPQRLTSGRAEVSIRDHDDVRKCQIKPTNDGRYCVDLSLFHLGTCGTKLKKSESTQTYSNTFLVLWRKEVQTSVDLMFHVSCTYSHKVDVSSVISGISKVSGSPVTEALVAKDEENEDIAVCKSPDCWSVSANLVIAAFMVFVIFLLVSVASCLTWMTQRRRTNARRAANETRDNDYRTIVGSTQSSPSDLGLGMLSPIEIEDVLTKTDGSPTDFRQQRTFRSHYDTSPSSSSVSLPATLADCSPDLGRHLNARVLCEAAVLQPSGSVDLGYSSSHDLVRGQELKSEEDTVIAKAMSIQDLSMEGVTGGCAKPVVWTTISPILPVAQIYPQEIPGY